MTKLSFQGKFWKALDLRISEITKMLRFEEGNHDEKCLKEKSGFC